MNFLSDHNPILTDLSRETYPNYFPSGENNTAQNISVSYISEHFIQWFDILQYEKGIPTNSIKLLAVMAEIHIEESS